MKHDRSIMDILDDLGEMYTILIESTGNLTYTLDSVKQKLTLDEYIKLTENLDVGRRIKSITFMSRYIIAQVKYFENSLPSMDSIPFELDPDIDNIIRRSATVVDRCEELVTQLKDCSDYIIDSRILGWDNLVSKHVK